MATQSTKGTNGKTILYLRDLGDKNNSSSLNLSRVATMLYSSSIEERGKHRTHGGEHIYVCTPLRCTYIFREIWWDNGRTDLLCSVS